MRVARLGHTSSRPSPAAPAWRNSLSGVLYGCTAGFLLGAAFWVMLRTQEPASGGAPAPLPFSDAPGGQAPDCTSLALDRRKGHTTAEPCLHYMLPLREARATGVGDGALP